MSNDLGQPDAPLLEVDQVSVSYRGALAVSTVSLVVEPGEWLTVIGPNGAGKSTLLKALAGVVERTGRISYRGDDSLVGRDLARVVAYVPQTPSLPIGMTTAEYVLLGRTGHLKWYQFESQSDRQLVAETLNELDLNVLAGRQVSELSGGEAQRVALARALVQKAEILLLDEPTSALDLAHQVAVLELVDRLRQQHSLAVVSTMHDLTIASRYSDQILLIDHGKTAVSGRPEQVLTPEVLSAHYGIEVAVMPGSHRGVIVLPVDKAISQNTLSRNKLEHVPR